MSVKLSTFIHVWIVLCLLLAVVPHSVFAAPKELQSGPQPLPSDCIGVTPLGEPPLACCLYVYVYVGGVPIENVNITVTSDYGQVSGKTSYGSYSAQPYFNTGLSNAPLSVQPGEVIKITASYNGMVSSRTWTVQNNAQQVDLGLVPGYQASAAPQGPLVPAESQPGVSSGQSVSFPEAAPDNASSFGTINSSVTQYLVNSSFEKNTGYPTNFSFVGPCNYTVYENAGIAYNGSRFLATNKNSSSSCYSFRQDIAGLTPTVGQIYRYAMWVRSSDGTPRSGEIVIWGLSGGTLEHSQGSGWFTTSGTNWQCVETYLSVNNPGNRILRSEMYLSSNDNIDYFFDQGTFTVGSGSLCPHADFGANVTGGGAPLNVSFADQSWGIYDSCAWTFGDGATSNTCSPAHTYFTPGVYNVSLRISGVTGADTHAKSGYITVIEPAVPALNAISNPTNAKNYEVSWGAVSGATGYTLEEALNSGAWNAVYSGASNAAYAASNRAQGVWCYRVRAESAAGPSAWSGSQCTTVNPPRTWLFLLYLDGDTQAIDSGNVHRLLYQATRQLAADQNPLVKVVALIDGPGALDSYRVTYTGTDAVYTAVGEKAMNDPATLASFISDARAEFPADYTYLAISDHANGVLGIAWDNTSGGATPYLTPAKIRTALLQATQQGQQPINILHFDGCSFNLLENMSLANQVADVVIASQNITWGVFAYPDYRSQVTINSTPESLAQAIAGVYASRVTSQSLPYTISAIRMSAYPQVLSAFNAYTSQLIDYASANQTNRETLATLRNTAQKFDSGATPLQLTQEDSYVDLVHFAELTRQGVTVNNIPTLANTLITSITGQGGLVIYESHRSGTFNIGEAITWNLDNAHGVSVYYPLQPSGNLYSSYVSDQLYADFGANSLWGEYLQTGMIALLPGIPVPPETYIPLTPLNKNQLFIPVIYR